MTYDLDTESAASTCTSCLDNYPPYFPLTTLDGVDGYAIPESARVGIAHPVTRETRYFQAPLPFMVRLVALSHDVDADLSGLVELLAVVPGVQVDDTYETFQCNGQHGCHPHLTVMYGRGRLDEGNTPKAHNPPLAIHRARQRANSVPPDRLLAEFWSIAQRYSNSITVYHDLILAWKPPVRSKSKRR